MFLQPSIGTRTEEVNNPYSPLSTTTAATSRQKQEGRIIQQHENMHIVEQREAPQLAAPKIANPRACSKKYEVNQNNTRRSEVVTKIMIYDTINTANSFNS